ncbi:ABC transporter permease subunit, partial [Bacillus pumilus]|uniref:ABC transporter permease subunit n=1 Tax=Bacillus pumilus TaxID=1408 RepID=UPI0034D978EA
MYTTLLQSTLTQPLQHPFLQYPTITPLNQRSIIFKHVFTIPISPILTRLPLNLPNLLTPTIILHPVFSSPPFPPFFIQPIFNPHLPLIQFYLLIPASIFIFTTFILHLLHLIIHPLHLHHSIQNIHHSLKSVMQVQQRGQTET